MELRDLFNEIRATAGLQHKDGIGTFHEPHKLIEDVMAAEYGSVSPSDGETARTEEAHAMAVVGHSDMAWTAYKAGKSEAGDAHLAAAEAHADARESHRERYASTITNTATRKAQALSAKANKFNIHFKGDRADDRNYERRGASEEVYLKGKTLVGLAARYSSRAQLPGFTEVIQPGAFRSILATEPDVVCLFNHDANMPLGRTSAGTLTLKETRDGLTFTCSMPDTSYAKDVYASIQRGDIRGCSFAFNSAKDDSVWTEERGEVVRTICGFSKLQDVSVVTHPAYADTNVVARAYSVEAEVRSFVRQIVPTQADAMKIPLEDWPKHFSESEIRQLLPQWKREQERRHWDETVYPGLLTWLSLPETRLELEAQRLQNRFDNQVIANRKRIMRDILLG